MNIELTGDAVKAIASHMGEPGVRHLLETMRMFAQAELNKSEQAPSASKRPKAVKTDADMYAQLRTKDSAQKRCLTTYRLVYCATLWEAGQSDVFRKYKDEFGGLESANPKDLALIAKWLKEQGFDKLDGLQHLRELLFAEHCDKDFELSYVKDLETLKELRDRDQIVGSHPHSRLIDRDTCFNIAQLWATKVKSMARNFPSQLNFARAHKTSQVVREEDLLLRLGLTLEEVDDYRKEWINVLTWVNNDILVVTDLGEIFYE